MRSWYLPFILNLGLDQKAGAYRKGCGGDHGCYHSSGSAHWRREFNRRRQRRDQRHTTLQHCRRQSV